MMAKQLKMANIGDQLLSRPELGKIATLDAQMHEISKNEKLSLDQKVKSFEEKLAEFKKLKDMLTHHRHWSVDSSYVKESDLELRVKDILLKLLKEDLLPQQQLKPETATVQRDVTQMPQHQQQGQTDEEMEFVTPGMESSISAPGIELTTSTPIGQKKKKSSRKRQQLFVPPNEHQYIKHILIREGVLEEQDNGDKIQIKAPGDLKPKYYAKDTLEKATNYVFSTVKSEKKPLPQWKNLISLIHQTLAREKNLQGTDGEIPQLGNPASDSHFSNTRLGNYG